MANLILKVFGLTQQEIQQKLQSVSLASFQVRERNFDATIEISGLTPQQQTEVCSLLAPYTYAYEDISIYEQVARLCSVRNRKLSLTEQGSGGIIAANLSQTSVAPSFLQTCTLLPNALQFVENANIEPRILTQQGIVQRVVLQQMVSHIETTQKVDLHIITLAQYQPVPFTSYATADVGTIYLAILNKEDVQIHKYNSPNTTKADIMHFTAKLACFALYQILK